MSPCPAVANAGTAGVCPMELTARLTVILRCAACDRGNASRLPAGHILRITLRQPLAAVWIAGQFSPATARNPTDVATDRTNSQGGSTRQRSSCPDLKHPGSRRCCNAHLCPDSRRPSKGAGSESRRTVLLLPFRSCRDRHFIGRESWGQTPLISRNIDASIESEALDCMTSMFPVDPLLSVLLEHSGKRTLPPIAQRIS